MSLFNIKHIIVCGGRDFSDYNLLSKIIDNVRSKYPSIVIVHGGARGADSLAHRYALQHNIEVKVHKADWDKYGKKAGYIRNAEMLKNSNPIGVIAFPGGKGTAHMVKIAKGSGYSTMVIGKDGSVSR